uniref:Uncharacterized protein n=1 Tax=Cucumis melo TaxID=3656 RepID=A0A9I9EJG9_CUCME
NPVARRRPPLYLSDFSSPQSPPSSTRSCVDRRGKMERDEKKMEKKMVEDGEWRGMRRRWWRMVWRR